MAILRSQFNQTLKNIEVNEEKANRAQKAHTEIRDLLHGDEQLREWGVDTKLIGSYRRDTGIYPGKDVDVFVKLTNLDTSAMPKEVYEAVRSVLVAEYGDVADGGRVSAQARSLKTSFPNPDDPDDENEGFAVDSVPAVSDGERWAIPTKDRSRWSGGAGRWLTTDPERLASLSTDLSTATWTPAVAGRNAYKPVVKLLRQARRTHLGDRRPRGLYIELATYEAWNAGRVTGDEWDTLFATTLRLVADRLTLGRYSPLIDPALGTPYSPAPDENDLINAADVFSRLANLATEALDEDDCQAAVRWREILGSNDRAEPVFPLPPGCDAEGRSVKNIAAVLTRGINEARGFG